MRILLSILACLALIAAFYIGFVKHDQLQNFYLIFTDDWGSVDLELPLSLEELNTGLLKRLAGDVALDTFSY